MNIHLSIVGSGHPDYEDSLRNLVSKHHLEDKVSFLWCFPHEEMPALLRKFDALVLPSIWEETMASGLTVIGTLTGGTGELLVEGETGLTFEPKNAEMLAQRIEQLYDDPALCRKLAENGRNRVISGFGMHRMVDEIEAYLEDVLKNAATINA